MIEINEKTLAMLEKLGISKALLQKANDGQATQEDLAKPVSAYFEPIIKERVKESLKADLEKEQEKALEEKIKEEKIGTTNALKKKVAKLLGVSAKADELKDLTVEELFDRHEEGKDSKDGKTDTKQLVEQLEQYKTQLQEKEQIIQSLPQKEQALRAQMLKEFKKEQLLEQVLGTFQPRLKVYNPKVKKLILDDLAEEGVEFDFDSKDGKETLKVLKKSIKEDGTPQLDKNGSPILVPYAKDTTSNYTAAEILEKRLSAMELLQAQATATPSALIIQPQNRPQDNKAAGQWQNVTR